MTTRALKMRMLLFILVSACWAAGDCVSSSAQAEQHVSEPWITLRLLPQKPDSQAVAIGKHAPIPLHLLSQRGGKMVVDGLGLRQPPGGLGVTVEARHKAIHVLSSAVPGWMVRLAPGAEATFQGRKADTLIDVSTRVRDQKSVQITLPDGGKVLLLDKAWTRLDYFKDQTYSLRGEGLLSATNADGQAVSLSRYLPPLSGGPLVTAQGPKGHHTFKRLTPNIDVSISGTLGQTLQVRFPDRTVSLAFGKKKRIDLRNGAAIELAQLGPTPRFVWSVVKGEFQLSIVGIDGYQLLTGTLQTGSLDWNEGLRVVDLKDLSPHESLLVKLPSSTFARVGPNSTLQCSMINSTEFSTAATGNSVVLYNQLMDKATDLTARNILFRKGQDLEALRAAANLPKQVLNLTWNKDEPVVISGLPGGDTIRVDPNRRKIVKLQNGQRFLIHLDATGTLHVDAISGSYEIHVMTVSGIKVAVPQGNSVALDLDMHKGTFVIKSNSANLDSVQYDASIANKTGSLQKGDAATFLFNPRTRQALTLEQDSGGSVTTTDLTGGGFPTPVGGGGGGNNPGLPGNNNGGAQNPNTGTDVGQPVDVSRINLPPLSPATPQGP